jgi:AAA family ATP:ADP antiporter
MNTVLRATRAPSRALVAASELPALLAAAGAYFCLLSGYYMLRSLREAMALEAGRENIPLLFYSSLAVMLAILPVYWGVVARTPRRWLVVATYAPVLVFFAALAVVFVSGHGGPRLAGAYFVGVTSLNLFMVTVFWGFMADVWDAAAAKRLFGYIAAGGSAGALAGPAVNALFVERLGAGATILVACALIAGTLALASLTRSARLRRGGAATVPDSGLAVGGRAIDDLRRLARSPYLLAIAGLIVAGQVLGAFMYNEQARFVEAAYGALEERAAFFARIDFAVNVLALLFQTLVVGWLTARGDVRLSLSAMPALAALSFLALAVQPVFAMLMLTQVVRRAADYGLAKPAREMLFTVVNPESKFKSKSLLDTALQRGGDSVGNALYVAIAAIGLAGIAWLSAFACAALIAVTWWLGGRFRDRQAQADGSGRPAS